MKYFEKTATKDKDLKHKILEGGAVGVGTGIGIQAARIPQYKEYFQDAKLSKKLKFYSKHLTKGLVGGAVAGGMVGTEYYLTKKELDKRNEIF